MFEIEKRYQGKKRQTKKITGAKLILRRGEKMFKTFSAFQKNLQISHKNEQSASNIH